MKTAAMFLLGCFLLGGCAAPAHTPATASLSSGQANSCAPANLPATRAAAEFDVTFCNADLVLHGQLYKPVGDGPFPAVVFNHGSEKDPRPYLDALAAVYTSRGYVFLAPFRRGQGTSPGPYIMDQLNPAEPSVQAALLVQLHEAQLGDQLAGLTYLQAVPFVNRAAIVVTGLSYGGIQTILGAEANPGYRAAVDCAGAAQTWGFSAPLRQRLLDAMARIQIPVFLLQARNDYDTRPSTLLAAELDRLGKPYRVHIYPPFGTGAVGQEGHNMCGPRGAPVWSADVFDFIGGALAQAP